MNFIPYVHETSELNVIDAYLKLEQDGNEKWGDSREGRRFRRGKTGNNKGELILESGVAKW